MTTISTTMNMHGNNSFLYLKSGSTIVAPYFPIILPNGWVRLEVEAEADVDMLVHQAES
jgi:hypothetical protein